MIRLLAPLLVLTLLAGCAVRPPAEAPSERGPWADQAASLEALDTWELIARVGLRTPEEATSANLDWRQTPYHYRLLLSGPFGSGRSTLEGRTGRVSLTTPEGRFEAESPEALLQEQLGWSLPVSALDHWVRGLPAAGQHDLERDPQGYPRRLRQAGWEIDYRDWTWAEGLWLPRRLVMSYDSLRVTLVVNEWRPEVAR
ncbi:lipoprotein insertase outer membrane protein LolB [Halomonas salifodinae]|uniref:lipoprotein insertase outer membrane protein LolB n=1 Tax=Halomonas salifodinae TaxID=438745 RepID=UPI0033B17138